MAWVRACGIGVSVCLLGGTAWAKPPVLPLSRVRLYETGVGYFERTGAVGAGAVTLPVPASHLDDALKTLVVFSADGPARVGGIEFGSSVSRSMGRALSGLGDGTEPLALTALLQSLKGAGVELRAAGEILNGRLVEVLDAETSDLSECLRAVGTDADASCEERKQPVVVLLTRQGELRRLKLSELRSARPTDPAFASRLGAALDALSDGSARLMKEVRVAAQAGKTLSLGYVSETPVWRATYRLVLSAKAGERAALQGWALVHNDTDEPWQRVGVELVNGRPDSFLFPLAAPRYAPRELVTPENELSTVPQLMRQTPDSMWLNDGAGGFGLSGVGLGGGGRGQGIGLGSLGTVGHGAGSGEATQSSLLSVGNLASAIAGTAVEAGALFNYRLGQPLDLRAHGSALVPFLTRAVSARRIVVVREAAAAARSGIYLVNDGNQTLPDGTLAIFGDGGFAGESALPRLKPHETTTLEFGFDLDVEVSQSSEHRDEPQQLRFSNTGLVEHYVRHHEVEYEIENRSGSPREVFVGLSYVNNAKIEGADSLVYSRAQSQYFASFEIASQASLQRTLKVDEGRRRVHPLPELTQTRLKRLAEAPSLPAGQRTLLLQAASRLAAADQVNLVLAARTQELAHTELHVTRFREHARALGVNGETMIRRLLAAEDRATHLRHETGTLAARSRAFRAAALSTLKQLGT
jgi:hypothetical protein